MSDIVEAAPPVGETHLAPTLTTSDQSIIRQREDMRGRLAMLLVSPLLFLIVAGFAPVWFGWGSVADITTLLDTYFAPVVAIVGTVAGFYFGEKVSEDRQASVEITRPNVNR